MIFHVPNEFQRNSVPLPWPPIYVGADINYQYLLKFVQLALYNFLHILSVHHGVIEHHLVLLQSLHAMITRFQSVAAKFSSNN